MSQKLNRLRNRLRIEQEQADRRERDARDRERQLRQDEARLATERSNLNRSVALRVRVQRDFTRPAGEAFALNVVLYPREFTFAFRTGREGRAQNATHYARERGYEIGHQVADVILRCLTGELDDFAKAQ